MKNWAQKGLDTVSLGGEKSTAFTLVFINQELNVFLIQSFLLLL